MSEKLKIQLWLNIGIANADQDDIVESDDYTVEEWNALSDDEKEEYLDMMAKDHLSNYVDCGAAVIDEGQ